MNLYKNNGFTLIEIIVSINLGFLLLTVIVSFFLFSNRFILSTTRMLDDRQSTNTFIQSFESKLKKANVFEIQIQDTTTIIIAKMDTIKVHRKSLSLMDLYTVENIQSYLLSIQLQNGDELIIENDTLKSTSSLSSNNLNIISSDVIELELKFNKSNQEYSSIFISPNISINRFRNIQN